MAGYKNRSMSNNAITAYESGERPLSKWTFEDFCEEVESETDVRIKRVKGGYKQFLKYSSWHHTSKFYNQTDFYNINFELLQNAIEDGRVILFTEEELEAKRLAAKAEFEQQLKERNDREEERQRQEAELLKEAESCEIIPRTTKKGRTVHYMIVTPEQKKLYNSLYLPVKEIQKHLNISTILEIKKCE